MTGHLLQTVNPVAAEPDEVPPIGARVQFFGRPGFGRGAQNVFACEVLHADPKVGTITAYVLFGREDWREYAHIPKRSEQNPVHCWDYLPDGYEELSQEVDELRAKLDTLENGVFGTYKRPVNPDGSPKSIIAILAEFEQRVFAAEKPAKK